MLDELCDAGSSLCSARERLDERLGAAASAFLLRVFDRVRALGWSGIMLLVAEVVLEDTVPNRSRIADRCLAANRWEKRVLCVVSCVLSPLRGLVIVISSV